MKSKLQKLWLEAEEDEIGRLLKWGTFEEVTKEELGSRKLITVKWVYDIQRDEKGNIWRLRARLVARGFLKSQV